MLRLPRWLSVLMLIAGLSLLLTPVAKEAYSRIEQKRLLAELTEIEDDPVLAVPPDVALDLGPSEPTAAPQLPALTPPFRIEIPRIGVDVAVLDDVTVDVLRKGPGLYPHGVKPGEEGNVSIAGHRTTYGAWFRHVDDLKDGDEIILSKGARRIVYHVETVFPVASNDWSVIAPTEYNALTLTTCHPPGSAIERLIVRAKEVENGYKEAIGDS